MIHAGDLTWLGREKEIRRELTLLSDLPHEHIVIIAGNHDWLWDNNAPRSFRGKSLYHFYSKAQILAKFPRITYLEDSSTEVMGWKIYGSPWQPWFHDWAFNFPFAQNMGAETQAKRTWAKIPDDTEILVTHCPPEGILDMSWDGRLGDRHLRRRVTQLDKLRLHVFGHNHEAAGKEEYEAEDGTKLTFVNAAICTREYKPTNPVITIDLERK